MHRRCLGLPVEGTPSSSRGSLRRRKGCQSISSFSCLTSGGRNRALTRPGGETHQASDQAWIRAILTFSTYESSREALQETFFIERDSKSRSVRLGASPLDAYCVLSAPNSQRPSSPCKRALAPCPTSSQMTSTTCVVAGESRASHRGPSTTSSLTWCVIGRATYQASLAHSGSLAN